MVDPMLELIPTRRLADLEFVSQQEDRENDRVLHNSARKTVDIRLYSTHARDRAASTRIIRRLKKWGACRTSACSAFSGRNRIDRRHAISHVKIFLADDRNEREKNSRPVGDAGRPNFRTA